MKATKTINTLQGTARKAYPGDQVCIMTADCTSVDGRKFQRGTEYTPQSHGNDWNGKLVLRVSIAGQTQSVVFAMAN